MKLRSAQLIVIIAILSTPLLAQNIEFGIGLAVSSNPGFGGLTGHISLEKVYTDKVNTQFRFNAFHDIYQDYSDPFFENLNQYHWAIYVDYGIEYKLMDEAKKWNIGIGPSLLFSKEKTNASADIFYDLDPNTKQTEKDQRINLGIHLINSIDLSDRIGLNLSIHSYSVDIHYFNIGPYFRF